MYNRLYKSQHNESVDEYQPTRTEEAQTDLLILDRIFEIADKLDAPNLDTDDHLYWVNQIRSNADKLTQHAERRAVTPQIKPTLEIKINGNVIELNNA